MGVCSMATSSTTAPQDIEEGPVWYGLSVDEALREEGTDLARGLTSAEAAARLEQYGPNAFTAAKKESGWVAFLRQYRDPMQIVLLVAGVVSGVAIQQWSTALVLLALTLVNAVMGLR